MTQISETQSKKFLTNAPPPHIEDAYPQVDPELPKLFPCAVFCGAVRSGKTTQCARLISQYIKLGARDPVTHKKLFHRVILYSPSIDANPVWTCISATNFQKSDKISGYSDDIMKALWDSMKNEKKARDRWLLELDLFTQMSKSEVNFDALTPELQQWLEQKEFKKPQCPCEHPEGVVYHVVLDDCLGQDCFKAQGKSIFTSFCLARRHARACVYVCTQSLKQVPRRLRQSISLWVLFKYASCDALLKDFYPEISNVMGENEFKMLYKHVLVDPHDFLVVDLSQPPERKLRNGWMKFVHLLK